MYAHIYHSNTEQTGRRVFQSIAFYRTSLTSWLRSQVVTAHSQDIVQHMNLHKTASCCFHTFTFRPTVFLKIKQTRCNVLKCTKSFYTQRISLLFWSSVWSCLTGSRRAPGWRRSWRRTGWQQRSRCRQWCWTLGWWPPDSPCWWWRTAASREQTPPRSPPPSVSPCAPNADAWWSPSVPLRTSPAWKTPEIV